MKATEKIKVIIIDDSRVITEALQRVLKRLEYIDNVGCARNVPRAIAMINQLKPDLIILDINLDEELENPEGILLLTTLRKKYPKLKIVMMTHKSGPQHRTLCMANGANYFLDKTKDMKLLPETLKQVYREKLEMMQRKRKLKRRILFRGLRYLFDTILFKSIGKLIHAVVVGLKKAGQTGHTGRVTNGKVHHHHHPM